jgi:hypothetical protein
MNDSVLSDIQSLLTEGRVPEGSLQEKRWDCFESMIRSTLRISPITGFVLAYNEKHIVGYYLLSGYDLPKFFEKGPKLWIASNVTSLYNMIPIDSDDKNVAAVLDVIRTNKDFEIRECAFQNLNFEFIVHKKSFQVFHKEEET